MSPGQAGPGGDCTKSGVAQDLGVRTLLRAFRPHDLIYPGSLPIAIVDKNDNAPYFLPNNQTFGE